MVLKPEDAAKANDEIILKEVGRLSVIIDNVLLEEWCSFSSHSVSIPSPEINSEKWCEQIISLLFAKYVNAGWSIQRQHDPSEVWIFKATK